MVKIFFTRALNVSLLQHKNKVQTLSQKCLKLQNQANLKKMTKNKVSETQNYLKNFFLMSTAQTQANFHQKTTKRPFKMLQFEKQMTHIQAKVLLYRNELQTKNLADKLRDPSQ